MPALQIDDDRQNLVVDLDRWQSRRQLAGNCFGLQEKAAAGQFAGRSMKRDAQVDGPVQAVDDLVERARHLASVAGDFRQAFLVVVEFLQGHHRQEDVVLLEAVDAGRIVHQDIGVEDEKLSGRGGSSLLGTEFGVAGHVSASRIRSVRMHVRSGR
ncbi:MAG: hypothetical protein AW09_001338 [Candidatus Accumulibacter phosphatis]|uniref:Uncharacterized protein n=1 Tax=Candidatus Accumulibacter phosphatis TaxID=327160 RepID=A0A080LXH9_9PROT|nr:MAG: hypothetical protein AW09_001338 [Candidatus Accumulibacter phosphatis]